MELDARLVRLGFKAGHRHVAGCMVGSVHGADCTCHELAVGRTTRRAQLLYR